MLASKLSAAPRPGTVLGGRYRIERSLGAGGMGAVYAATHLELRQEVAIKVLLPGSAKSEEAQTRFMREGRAAARLTSPFAAKVFDTGRLPSGEPYLVMELLSGRDLRAYMSEVPRVPLEQAVEWVLQASHALGEAHKLNVIHRDVKPANLFLAETSAGNVIKVLDFGVSKQLDEKEADLTNTASVLGTPRYMAPEQMRSARLADQRCDVWSLGVVLYELTTGEAPFRGDSVTALCFDVMERTPSPASRHNAELPPAFDALVARCLAKDPDERFATMEALAEALRPFAPSTRLSLPFSADLTPAAAAPSSFQPSSTPAATVGLRTPVEASPRTGSGRWMVAVGLGVGVAAAAVLTLTLVEPEVRSATALEPAPQATATHSVVGVTSTPAPQSSASPNVEPRVEVAPSAAVASSVVLAVDTPLPSSAQPTTASGTPKRPAGGQCDPPTWRDKNNRLVPKPYCL